MFFYKEGHCNQGKNCEYSHDIPKDKGKGKGKGKEDLSQKPCTYFAEHGTCRWGEKCKFSNDVEVLGLTGEAGENEEKGLEEGDDGLPPAP